MRNVQSIRAFRGLGSVSLALLVACGGGSNGGDRSGAQGSAALHGDVPVLRPVVAVAHDALARLDRGPVHGTHRQPGRLRDVDAGEVRHATSVRGGVRRVATRPCHRSPRRGCGRSEEPPVASSAASGTRSEFEAHSHSFGPVWWRSLYSAARRPAIGWSKTASCRLTGSAPAASRRTHPRQTESCDDACLRPSSRPPTPSTSRPSPP